MRQKILFTLIAAGAFHFASVSPVLCETYHFRNYSVDDGLPHPVVTAIFQDRDGYLWFGTHGGGVSRFDGRTFKNYSTGDGLVLNLLTTSIFQDREGNLWFTTHMGVSKFDGENWTTLEREKGVPFVANIWCGLEDSKGRLWFGTGGGLAMVEGDSLRLIDTEELGAGIWVTSMIEDIRGNLWLATEDGALKYDGAEWTTHKTGYLSESGVIFADSSVVSIFEDSRGNIWFGGHGVVSKFDGTNWTAYSLGPGFEGFSVGSMCEDREGNLWLGQYHPMGYVPGEKGVVKFDGAKFSYYTTENGLAHNQVISLFTDREGNVWLGTNGRGVCKFGGARFTTYTTDDGLAANQVAGSGYRSGIFEDSRGNLWCLTAKGISRFDGKNWFTYNKENVLKRDRIYSICEDRKGNIWFSAASWVVKFDGKRFTNYPTAETGLYFGIESPILEDDEGNLWFGSNHHGVSRFDGENWTNLLEQGKIPGSYTLSTFKDSKGNLWFGNWRGLSKVGSTGLTRYDGENWITYTSEGLGIYDGDKGIIFYTQDSIFKFKYDGEKWDQYASQPRTAEDEEIENYFAGNRCAGYGAMDILEDRQGNVWFATWGGASKYDGENWTTYTTEDGLADNKVSCIFEDTEGNLWFGTGENGVSRFDGREFTSYTTEDGLSSNICYYIFQDGVYIYIGTAAGLSRFDGENFRVINARDGLAASELTNSYLKDSKGNLWFGTANGLTKYNPALDRPNVVAPPVYLTGVSLFGRDISGREHPGLDYDENNLRFDYIGICLTSPEEAAYRYMLDGLDNDWIETAEHSVAYPYLPPGEYTFKVTACNNDGVWNRQPVEFGFEIYPPFWATNWFRGSILAVVLAILWGVHETRTRNMKRRNIELEAKVKERTLELEESNKQLTVLNERLTELDKLKSNFLSTVSHELRTPLTSIRAFSEILIDSRAKEEDTEELHFMKIINEESERLSRLIEDLLDLSRIESGRQKWVMTHFNIKEAVDKSVTATSSLVEGKNLSLEVSFPDEVPTIYGDLDKLVQVVTNLISNSVKFTPEKGRIDIKARTIEQDDREFIEVSVSDTGEGIPADQLEKVFEKFHQVVSDQTHKKGGTGLGLSISREILKHHGGRIRVESELGAGSTFYFTLPVVEKKKEKEPEVQVERPAEIPVAEVKKGAKSILVVDDEAHIREFLKYELDREGYRVLEAESGEQALKLAREHLPDAITLDILMPGEDGFEVLSELKKDPSTEDIPVLIVTIVDDVEKGYRLGAYDYHVKPLDRAKFLSSIQGLLGKIPEKEKRKVLVVDDDKSIVQALEKILQDEGFETVAAFDGEEALEKVDAEKPDLVVMDVKMPKIDGYQVMKRLKAKDETKDIPVIVLTASELGKSRKKSMILGAKEYFTKPFSKEELVEGLKRALESQESEARSQKSE